MARNFYPLRLLFLFAVVHVIDSTEKETKGIQNGKMVPVKIVEMPAVLQGYGYGNAGGIPSQTQMEKVLTPRVDPQPFNGPAHFSPLVGKCFTLTDNSYKYEVCPFTNVTQREQSIRWNAFQGILGIWHQWIIVGNTLEGMLMKDGDLCAGGKARQTKVLLRCGSENKVLRASEPDQCQYEVEFHTPYACPQDALLVYPFLSAEGQKEWEEIEKEMYLEELTKQGYEKRRTKLFMREKFYAAPKSSTSLQITTTEKKTAPIPEVTQVKSGTTTSRFSSLEECSKAYEDLIAEVKRLREALNMTTSKATESPAQADTKLVHENTPSPEKGKLKTTNNNLTNTMTKEEVNEKLVKTTNMPASSKANPTVHSIEETTRIRNESKTVAPVTSERSKVSNSFVGQPVTDDNVRTKDKLDNTRVDPAVQLIKDSPTVHKKSAPKSRHFLKKHIQTLEHVNNQQSEEKTSRNYFDDDL